MGECRSKNVCVYSRKWLHILMTEIYWKVKGGFGVTFVHWCCGCLLVECGGFLLFHQWKCSIVLIVNETKLGFWERKKNELFPDIMWPINVILNMDSWERNKNDLPYQNDWPYQKICHCMIVSLSVSLSLSLL